MIFTILITLFLSFLICFFTLPTLIKISKKYSIYDHPNHLKKHEKNISYLGGIAILFSFHITTRLSTAEIVNQPIYFDYYLSTLMIIFFYGLGDDIFNYKPYKKFIFQIIVSIFLVHKMNIYVPLENMYPFMSKTISISITILILIAITNAFNLIDGADGIATSIALMTTIFYAILFFLQNNIFFCLIAVSLSGSLIGFLCYNKPPAYIFMGDSGSLFIGMIIGTFIIILTQNQKTLYLPNNLNQKILIGISTLTIPVFDMIRLFATRILDKKNPFKGDTNHIHHLFNKIGFSKNQTLFFIITIQILTALSSMFFYYKNLILVYSILFLIYLATIKVITIIIDNKEKIKQIIVENKSNYYNLTKKRIG